MCSLDDKDLCLVVVVVRGEGCKNDSFRFSLSSSAALSLGTALCFTAIRAEVVSVVFFFEVAFNGVLLTDKTCLSPTMLQPYNATTLCHL